jgi:hypothetical protein
METDFAMSYLSGIALLMMYSVVGCLTVESWRRCIVVVGTDRVGLYKSTHFEQVQRLLIPRGVDRIV